MPGGAAAAALLDHDAAPHAWAELTPTVRQSPVGGVRPLQPRSDKGHTDHSHLSGQQRGDRHLPSLLGCQAQVPPHECQLGARTRHTQNKTKNVGIHTQKKTQGRTTCSPNTQLSKLPLQSDLNCKKKTWNSRCCAFPGKCDGADICGMNFNPRTVTQHAPTDTHTFNDEDVENLKEHRRLN